MTLAPLASTCVGSKYFKILRGRGCVEQGGSQLRFSLFSGRLSILVRFVAQSRFGAVKSKPIVSMFNVFRDSFNFLCEGLGVSTLVDRLQHIGHRYAASDDAWDI
jgi:hypothetical protein